MYSKAQLMAAIKKEVSIIKHLGTQVPTDQYGYRPTPPQRSTLELMQYLTLVAHSSVRYAIEGSWDWWEAMDAEAKAVTPETFAKAMDKQLKQVAKLLKPFTDNNLRKKKVKTWAGKTLPMGEALIDMVLKPLVAYRTQLFLYAKASGASTIGTSDLWHGKTAKPPKMKAAKA
jgi:hypothetical protein